jgi:pimeloyl-ACP methyl ester carboxylesterase
MPVLGKRSKYYDYVPIFPYSHERIEAAIDFYKQQGIDNIILIAHGCGAHMAMSYIDKYGDSAINAYVGVGMGATDYKQKVVKFFPLDKMKVPILDVFGERDFAGVKRMAAARKNQIEAANNPQSAQMMIKKAKHYYKEKGSAEDLAQTIDTWMSGLK